MSLDRPRHPSQSLFRRRSISAWTLGLGLLTVGSGCGSTAGGSGSGGAASDGAASGGRTSGGTFSGGGTSGEGSGGAAAGAADGGAASGGRGSDGAGGNAGGEAGAASGGEGGVGGSPAGTGPCYEDACEGTCEGSCDDGFVCNTQRVVCTADLAEFCGCDGETFLASSSCPHRAYQHQGSCQPDVAVNCDARDIACLPLVAPEPCPSGEVYSVSAGGCYGECVPINSCACGSKEECPDPSGTDEFTCIVATGRCSYWLK